MTRQRYTIKESLNRILRIFQNKAIPLDDPDTITGEVLTEGEAFSDLAELLADSLPNEDAILPPAFIASVAEANEPDSPINTRAMTPASHQWAHEYGGIYTTGSATELSLASASWTKLTGTFQYYMLDSGSEIDCDWNDDRIVVNEIGTYMVMYSLSIFSNANAINLSTKVFVNGTMQQQTLSKAYYGLSGTAGNVYNLFGVGYTYIISGSYAVDIRAKPDANMTIQVLAGQLVVNKAVG